MASRMVQRITLSGMICTKKQYMARCLLATSMSPFGCLHRAFWLEIFYMADDRFRGKSFRVQDAHYGMAQARRFCDPSISTCSPVVLQADSRHKLSDVTKSFNPYEPRPRRRTNVDRYEPNKGTSAAGQRSPRTKRSQKRMTMMKRNNTRVDKKFYAKNVKSGRLTVSQLPSKVQRYKRLMAAKLTSNANLGIFKKGKTSEPISYPKETKFLGKEAQCPEDPEERTQQSRDSKESPQEFSSEYHLDTVIEQELFQSLANCQQLNIPYEEYVPVTSNVQILSVADLGELYSKRNHIESRQKSAVMYATGTRTSAYDQTNALPPTHAGDIPTNSLTKDKEMLLDLLLDTVQDFDEDVAVEFLAELVDAAEPSSENCKPQPVDLRAGSVEGPPNPTEEFSCLCSYNSGNDHASGSPVSMTGKIRNETSANFGIPQKQHDNDPSSNALDAWHWRDMEREIIAGDHCGYIFSGLDVHRFGRRATPVYTTNQPSMPASVPPARRHATTEPTLHRRFWRCNKLY
ncbi:hypothetical protein UA08_08040 [Talaromyces atroroseus]|uniref:Uncharacterized protein n=1 Tax=Talaromyces atroroseus TaxID=1441469 RepID=A0A225A9X6_TALAT|nr:hypothetical protein UA08_08040 [Talaromyces atroroseus]OKL56890.1 hypothetical protein UA08_08040 [Talaromyces atroroseus]